MKLRAKAIDKKQNKLKTEKSNSNAMIANNDDIFDLCLDGSGEQNLV